MTIELKNLYEEKKELVDKMESIHSEVKKRNGKINTEERETFEKLEKEVDDLNLSVEFHKRLEQKNAKKEVESISNDEGEDFRGANGKEIPLFTRSSKKSVRQHYENNNDYDDCLRGMTFGRYVRAHLFGAKNDQEERALSEGTNSAGGFTVPEIVSADFVDRLRPISRVLSAGANLFTIDNKTDKYNLAKLASGISIEWLSENSESTPGDVTFANVQFGFKTARAIVKVSNELVQDSLNLERVISQEAVRSFASEFDRVALVGSSGSGEPVGIVNYTDHETVSMATNGAAPTGYDEIIALIMELQSNNANVDGMTSAIMHPRTLAAYNSLVSTADEQPIQRANYIANMPFLHTTAVPIDDTYGSSSVASKIFLGDWSQLYYGMRLGVTILPLNQRYAEFNQTAFMIVARMDVQPYHEESFGFVQGVLGASLPT